MFEIWVFLISFKKPLQMCLSQILTKTPDFILHNLINLQVDLQEIEKYFNTRVSTLFCNGGVTLVLTHSDWWDKDNTPYM